MWLNNLWLKTSKGFYVDLNKMECIGVSPYTARHVVVISSNGTEYTLEKNFSSKEEAQAFVDELINQM